MSSIDYSAPQSPSVMTTVLYGLPRNSSPTITPYRSLARVVQPTVEPVSLLEAKAHCRVDTETDDAYIQGLISTAREYVEEIHDVTLISSTWEARYYCFPLWELVLPRLPMLDALITVTYRDQEGNFQSITSTAGQFQVDRYAVPGRIYPLYANYWPPVRGDENSVIVNWQAGYGPSGDSVPRLHRNQILLLVGHWYVNRESVGVGNYGAIPMTFDTLRAAADWGAYR